MQRKKSLEVEEEDEHVIRANWKQDGGGSAEFARPARKSQGKFEACGR